MLFLILSIVFLGASSEQNVWFVLFFSSALGGRTWGFFLDELKQLPSKSLHRYLECFLICFEEGGIVPLRTSAVLELNQIFHLFVAKLTVDKTCSEQHGLCMALTTLCMDLRSSDADSFVGFLSSEFFLVL